MSVEHMRGHKTLGRNIEMTFAVQNGADIQQVAKRWKTNPSSVRSSVERTTGYIMHFVQQFPEKLATQDPRKTACKAFAKHVGVKVKLAVVRKKREQLELSL